MQVKGADFKKTTFNLSNADVYEIMKQKYLKE